MHLARLALFLALPLILGTSIAQTPNSTPVIVEAATAPTPNPRPAVNTSATTGSGSVEEAVKLLQQMKTANQDILKRQEAALQQLDELRKAAEQLKVFSKRG